MSEPLLSVIIPAQNSAPYISSALRSVFGQNYPNLEVWVVDDGSEDETREIISSYGDSLHCIFQEARGPSSARNAALREAQGSIIAFLDADDLWAPGHLRRMANLLEMDPAAGLAQGWIRNWRSGHDTPVSYCSNPYNFSILCSTVFRRSAVDQIGLFDPSLRFGEDSDFYIRAWEQHIPKCVDATISLHYHRHGSNMTTDKNLQQLGVVQVYKRRLDRIRKGMLDQDAIRGVGLREYLGEPPAAYDDGRYEPVGDEILGYLK